MADQLRVALQITLDGADQVARDVTTLATEMGSRLPQAAGRAAQALDRVETETRQVVVAAQQAVAQNARLRASMRPRRSSRGSRRCAPAGRNGRNGRFNEAPAK